MKADNIFSINDFEIKIFENNLFIPANHTYIDIPDKPGNYIICLNDGCELPSLGCDLKYSMFQNKKVIYTGIAGTSLRNRDFKQHFIGNNAGRSTLRLSIGILLGYQRIYRDKNLERKKYKFCENDEKLLSAWMNKNLVMYYLIGENFKQIESHLINQLNPPLNIKENKSIINTDFRRKLSHLRSASILNNKNSSSRVNQQSQDTELKSSENNVKTNLGFKSQLRNANYSRNKIYKKLIFIAVILILIIIYNLINYHAITHDYNK